MKKCDYCGRENGDEAVLCRECGTDFEEKASEPPAANAQNPPRPKGFIIALAVVFVGALATIVLSNSSPTLGGISVTFTGYATNAAGLRIAQFSVANTNDCAIQYVASCVPGWTNLLQGGNVPPQGSMRFEAKAPAGVRYKFVFTYCSKHSRFMDRVHRIWSRVAVWLPHKHELVPVSDPGFGSRTIIGPEVGP